jgi:DNA ligase 1
MAKFVPGTDDKPDFEAVISRFLSSKSEHSIQYCVFDILYYEEKSVMLKPLIELKELLERILPSNDLFVYVRHFEGKVRRYMSSLRHNH